MQWKAAPEELTDLFAKELEKLRDVEPKKMFGYLAGFTGGNMFAGIFQDSIVLRLPEDARAEFIKKTGGEPFAPMPGRVMKEYVLASKPLLKKRAELASWLEKARAYTATLPKKAKKAAEKKASGKKR
ncbi:MAG TPA: TfoX/Sxy family protein [Thermoanaerobaculia bacterium]